MRENEKILVVEKTAWMVSGNKGGVGKSIFCKALASALEMRGQTYAILDGDGRVGDVYQAFLKKCPALWADFRELRPDSPNCSQDGVYEGMIHNLLRGSDNLIINTPDGADAMLMKWFDATLAHTEINNFRFKFMYLMSDRPDGLDILSDLAKRFSFFYPVKNLYFGSPVEFDFFNRNFAGLFKQVIQFKELRKDELKMLFDLHTYPTEALRLRKEASIFAGDQKNNGVLSNKSREMYAIPALSRARLQAWTLDVLEAVGDAIDNNDLPNVKTENKNDKSRENQDKLLA